MSICRVLKLVDLPPVVLAPRLCPSPRLSFVPKHMTRDINGSFKAPKETRMKKIGTWDVRLKLQARQLGKQVKKKKNVAVKWMKDQAARLVERAGHRRRAGTSLDGKSSFEPSYMLTSS